MDLTSYISALFLYFIIMDPLGNIPVFVILMEKLKKKERTNSAFKSITVASIVLILFLFFGEKVLSVFNITLNNFQIAGGIILFIFGLKLALGLRIAEKRAKTYDVAVVPIGIPLITGPAVITITIILAAQYGWMTTLLAAIPNLVLSYFALRYSDKLFLVIGRHGADALSRILGLLLTALGVGLVQAGGLF